MMVEGGANVLTSMLKAREGLVDLVVVTISPRVMKEGGYKAIQAPQQEEKRKGWRRRKEAEDEEEDPWMVRFGEGEGGWEVYRLGKDVVFVGRPA